MNNNKLLLLSGVLIGLQTMTVFSSEMDAAVVKPRRKIHKTSQNNFYHKTKQFLKEEKGLIIGAVTIVGGLSILSYVLQNSSSTTAQPPQKKPEIAKDTSKVQEETPLHDKRQNKKEDEEKSLEVETAIKGEVKQSEIPSGEPVKSVPVGEQGDSARDMMWFMNTAENELRERIKEGFGSTMIVANKRLNIQFWKAGVTTEGQFEQSYKPVIDRWITEKTDFLHKHDIHEINLTFCVKDEAKDSLAEITNYGITVFSSRK